MSQNVKHAMPKKTLQLKIKKKRMNIANFINIYIQNLYSYILCDKNDLK